MPVKNPQFEINVRKNTNANNPGYGKYYPKAKEKQTISLRGLTNHMAGHNCIYGRDIIEGVLTKMSSSYPYQKKPFPHICRNNKLFIHSATACFSLHLLHTPVGPPQPQQTV